MKSEQMGNLATACAVVRSATSADGPACAEIYREYTRTAVVNLEIDPPSADEMSQRIEDALATYAWTVAERNGQVIGYASAGSFLARAAFRQAALVGIYVHPDHRGHGIGLSLYADLFDRLLTRDFRVALALVVPTNSRSIALHTKLGFDHVGTWSRVAWKHGAWRDLACMQRMLCDERERDATGWATGR